MPARPLAVCSLALGIVLAACGGGAGADGSSAPPSPVPRGTWGIIGSSTAARARATPGPDPGPPPPAPLLPQIDAQFPQATAPCFVALREALAGPSGALDTRYDSGDGVHPNDAGHAVIHARVRELIDGGRCVDATRP